MTMSNESDDDEKDDDEKDVAAARRAAPRRPCDAGRPTGPEPAAGSAPGNGAALASRRK